MIDKSSENLTSHTSFKNPNNTFGLPRSHKSSPVGLNAKSHEHEISHDLPLPFVFVPAEKSMAEDHQYF